MQNGARTVRQVCLTEATSANVFEQHLQRRNLWRPFFVGNGQIVQRTRFSKH